MKLATLAAIFGLALALSAPAHASRYQVCHKVMQHQQWEMHCAP
ncbi:hypothetical protein [Paraburkholderia sp. J12]|nr:hypothetical protein [Paraburkholderia sp. J12]